MRSILTVLLSISFCFGYAQTFERGILKINNKDIKEGSTIKVNNLSGIDTYNNIISGSTRLITYPAYVHEIGGLDFTIINIKKKNDKIEAKIKPIETNRIREAVNLLEGIWITDIATALKSKEISID
jgi:hypothetical protein